MSKTHCMYIYLSIVGKFTFVMQTKYSGVPNKRVGWNKCVEGKIMGKSINMLDGINVLVGNF